MHPLKKNEITVGQRVVFVDRRLNKHDAAHVRTDRSSVPLDGEEGVVVYVNPRDDHDATCASKTVTVKVKGKHWEGEGDDRKEVEHELEEHAGCDCGFRPGQPVAVALKKPNEKAHSCDGFVPMTSPVTTIGDDGEPVTKQLYHGVWARPGHIYTLESHAAHKSAHEKAAAVNLSSDSAKQKAADVAKAYVAGDARETQTITAADVATVPAEAAKPHGKRR